MDDDRFFKRRRGLFGRRLLEFGKLVAEEVLDETVGGDLSVERLQVCVLELGLLGSTE